MNGKQLRDFLNQHNNVDHLRIVVSLGDHQYRIADATLQTAEVVGDKLYEYGSSYSLGTNGKIVDVILIN